MGITVCVNISPHYYYIFLFSLDAEEESDQNVLPNLIVQAAIATSLHKVAVGHAKKTKPRAYHNAHLGYNHHLYSRAMDSFCLVYKGAAKKKHRHIEPKPAPPHTLAHGIHCCCGLQ